VVVQETLLRAWRHPEVLDQSERSARTWLFTVARHIVIDDWRRRRSRLVIPTATVPERPTADDADAVLQSWLIADAVQRLTPRHRAVLIECLYHGHTVTEAAARLGVPGRDGEITLPRRAAHTAPGPGRDGGAR
jgi:RNA polymerase sigma-70 factor (ECF subfamily)